LDARVSPFRADQAHRLLTAVASWGSDTAIAVNRYDFGSMLIDSTGSTLTEFSALGDWLRRVMAADRPDVRQDSLPLVLMDLHRVTDTDILLILVYWPQLVGRVDMSRLS
jgi:hypothetical protein